MIANILCILYFAIGIILTFYWYITKYKNDITEDCQYGIISIIFIICIAFWPIKLLFDFWKKYNN